MVSLFGAGIAQDSVESIFILIVIVTRTEYIIRRLAGKQ
jgi:hypothetical protein